MLDSLFNFSEEAGFIGLFIASFLAATLLPGGSEVVLIAVLAKHPDALLQAVAIATVGNTLGGVTSYLIGRMIPNKAQHKAVIYLHKYGYWALLFSWVPLFGDALCVAAGWLRFNPSRCCCSPSASCSAMRWWRAAGPGSSAWCCRCSASPSDVPLMRLLMRCACADHDPAHRRPIEQSLQPGRPMRPSRGRFV